MKKFEVIYLPIGVPTFHLESAQKAFDASKDLIKKYEPNAIVPDQMLLSIDDLQAFMADKKPDLLIVQNVTFAHSAYMTEILKTLEGPILLWTLKEPVVDGSRLRLNSLTGAFSAGFAHKAMRNDNLQYIYGAPEEKAVYETLDNVIKAARMKYRLKHTKLAMIGHTPEGFGFGRALDLEMADVFGVNLQAIESRELTNKARSYSNEDVKEASDLAHESMVGLKQTKEKNQVDFIKLFQAYKDYVENNNIDAIASRCWPDFFNDYGTPVCGVLGMLNDLNIAAACEADAYGALSMFIGQQLSEEPTYLGDPVYMDKAENTITFWHCGTSACGLARKDTGAQTGVHPNRKIGPTMEFGLKSNPKATIFRIGRKPDGTFRFFLAPGEILDKPKQFLGTSMVVKVENPVEAMITRLVKDGWEPHYAVLYDDVIKPLEILAEMLNIEVVKY